MTDDNGLYYMRQRYYNTEIKRFINQDVIRGNLSNSQSLNRYSYVQGNPISYTDPFGLSPLSGLFSGTGIIHAVLGLLGCVPGPVGIIANVVDAVVYAFVDHDYGMAFLAALSAVTLGAANVAKAAKAGSTLAKTANAIGSVAGVVTNLTNFALCAKVAADTIGVMYEKYVVQGQSFDKSTLGEIITLGTAFFGCIVSGKGLANETKQLSKMMQETQEASVLTGSFTENAPDIKVSEGKYAPVEDCRISTAASSGQNAVGFEIQYKSHNGASSGGITVSKTNNTKSSSKTRGGKYSKVKYEGTTKVGGQSKDISRKVYQRNDIDWSRVDPATGLTNKELAQRGNAPYANDGSKIELHHLLQQEPGPMVEIPASLHDKYFKQLHGLVGDGESFRNNPDLEKQYNNFRSKYWKWRVKNL